MPTFLRVLVFEWILARIGLRWLITVLIATPIVLITVVGIPTLLIGGGVAFLLWRWLRKPAPSSAEQGAHRVE
jgi:hypothetical protein